ncbi:hypothetical protein AB0A69_17785 [Streptomyces sp. NPDC045431]|uniref:hypothetical protein n=1 Tax=Streptomyces sp. NPDC045431 TaxID=3155613 RepID=UPI003403086F
MTNAPVLPKSRTPLRSFLRFLAWGIGGVVLTVLCVFVAGAVYLERSIEASKDAASIDLVGDGPYTLVPGYTARYEDNVRATVSAARRIPPVPNDDRRPGQVTFEFSVTYVNDSDKTLGIDAFDEITEEGGTSGYGAELAVNREAPRSGEDWFPETLAPGERVTVPVQINVSADADAVVFETFVTDGYPGREAARWKLPLSG